MKNFKFAIIRSVYTKDISDLLLEGAINRLVEHEITLDNIESFDVPGAIEIPLTAQLLAKSQKFDVLITLGCVIKGETDHYHYVCEQVSFGCQRVMLDHNIPIIFEVLLVNNLQQALDRVGGVAGHKGIEAADAALEMAKLLQKLSAKYY